MKKKCIKYLTTSFRFDDYKNGYVTTEMAINHLKRIGIVEHTEDEDVVFKEFTLIDIELPQINNN